MVEVSRTHDAVAIRRHIKALLPKEAFKPDAFKAIELLAHVAVLIGGYLVLTKTESTAITLLTVFMIGHSHLCIGLIAHDISHGAVVRTPALRYALSVFAWGLNITPATVWTVNHNRTHHRQTNAPEDSFRYFSDSERTPARRFFATLFMPNRRGAWSPLVFISYTVLLLNHTTLALFAPSSRRAGVLSNLGKYSGSDRLRVAFEVSLIVLGQFGVYTLVGGDLETYLVAGPFSRLVGSALAAAYLYTQHGLHSLTMEDDPLGSTSLRSPSWLDRMHSYTAHHTAHHLFEGASSRYLPEITRLLEREFPGVLHRVSWVECWRELLRTEPFRADPPAEHQTAL